MPAGRGCSRRSGLPKPAPRQGLEGESLISGPGCRSAEAHRRDGGACTLPGGCATALCLLCPARSGRSHRHSGGTRRATDEHRPLAKRPARGQPNDRTGRGPSFLFGFLPRLSGRLLRRGRSATAFRCRRNERPQGLSRTLQRAVLEGVEELQLRASKLAAQ